VRGFVREPMFAMFVVVTLALGIGANAAMFGVVDRLLLRGPEHVRDADRVVRVYLTWKWSGGEERTSSTTAYATYANLKESSRSFEQLAAYAIGDARLGSGVDAEKIRAGTVTWDFFPLLGARPLLGRFFGADEDRPPRGERVVVLGYGLWQRHFGGDRNVIGQTITLYDEPYTVIGVAPKGFTGAELQHVDAWVPMSSQAHRMMSDWATTWDAKWAQVIGRLEPGVTREQVAADATGAFRRGYTGRNKAEGESRLSVAPLRYDRQAKETPEASVARWLMGMAAIVLLTACANVGNLLLARALRRRREIAVRLALGVSRRRLVQLLFAEGMLLALAGGLASLLVAHVGGRLLRATLLPDVDWSSSTMGGRVLVVAALVALGTGVLIGLIPVLRGSRDDLTDALKTGVREGGSRRSWMRSGLTGAQAALSVVLLVGAGLFVRSLWNVRGVDLGIQPERVISVRLSWPVPGTLAEAEQGNVWARRGAMLDEATERIRRMPGVERASSSIGVPFWSSYAVDIRVPGWDSIPKLAGGGPYISAVAPDYFATVGTRIVSGRAFGPDDRAGSERVAIVSETMARTLWPGRDAIGECLIVGADTMPCSRVVGVAQDVHRWTLRDEPALQYYIPLGQETGIGGRSLLIRPRGDASALISTLRSELHRLDPSLQAIDIQQLQDRIDPQLRPWQLGATMFGIFGALALIVAAIGLYSVVAYAVTQRTHEFGVRLALGARSGDILRIVVRQGATTAVAGTAIGIVVAVGAGRFIEPLLFETSARNPVILATVACVLVLVAIIASLIPAWRAKRVDPVVALRAD
jgi:predicted permease